MIKSIDIMYAVYLILLGLSIISNCTLIFILYHRSQRSPAIIAFILFLILANVWITPKFITNFLDAPSSTFETLSRLSAFGYVFFPAVFLTFSLLYANYFKIFERFFFWVFLNIPSFIFLYLSWTTNIIGVHDYNLATRYAWGYETPTGEYFNIFVAWFVSLMSISLIALILHYKRLEDKIKKKQLFYVILSIMAPLFVGTITNGILPILNIFIFPTGIVLGNLMSVIIAYAIYRWGLFVVTPLTVLASIQQAIIAVDLNGRILRMNPSAEDLLKTKEASVLGRDLSDILHIEHRYKKQKNRLKLLVKSILKTGTKRVFNDFKIINMKHNIYFYSISVSPIYSEKKIIGANILLRDSKREYEKGKLKDDYFSMLYHELKTPITSVKLLNQLLLKEITGSNDKKKYYILKIESQVDRIKRLVQDFYELSMLHTGKLKVDKEFFIIDDLIHEAVETMRLTNTINKIKIEGAPRRLVFADKVKIEQVFINLINNAIKYSPPHKPINITLQSDASVVTIGVRDFGIGMAAKYHRKIFDRFYRINSQSPKKAGLGIGLYIAASIIKYHQGKIWVESKLGKGSTFYFSLPASRRAGGNPASTVSRDYDLSYK